MEHGYAVGCLPRFICKNEETFRFLCLVTYMQHGFMKNKSTITQLILVCEQLYQSNESGKPADFIYFDFSKAFDKVRHDILLSKLANIGFDEAFITLIDSYLSHRSQRVKMAHFCLKLFMPPAVFLRVASLPLYCF